jgi:hypothetical protein
MDSSLAFSFLKTKNSKAKIEKAIFFIFMLSNAEMVFRPEK